jgi:hypothetical protein
MTFAVLACYLGGFAGCLVHFREETDATWYEAIGMSWLWPGWLGLALWNY